MIFASSRAGAFMKRELWIWPIIAVVLLSIIGLFVRSAIRRTMEANIASVLNTLLDVEVGMLDTWFDVQLATAEAAANNQNVRRHVYQLLVDLEGVSDDAGEPADLDDLRRQLARELGPVISSHDYVGFIIADESQTIIASSSPDLIGQEELPEFRSWLTMALDGQSTVSPPFPSVRAIKDETGRMHTEQPTMYVVAPIRDESFQVVAALGLQIRPEQDFTEILQIGRIATSGETYAFNHEGVMVSNSRFDEDLILLGLLPDRGDARSMLTI